jgi:hypothetical protein
MARINQLSGNPKRRKGINAAHEEGEGINAAQPHEEGEGINEAWNTK